MRNAYGMTLLELLFTLALLTIITSMAAPAMGRLVADIRLSSAANDWLTTALHTRQEAMSRGRSLIFCPGHEDTCSNNGDSGAWLAGVPQPDDRLQALRYLPPAPSGVERHSNRHRFHFHPDGSATNGSVVFCDQGARVQARVVILNLAGRPRIEQREHQAVCATAGTTE